MFNLLILYICLIFMMGQKVIIGVDLGGSLSKMIVISSLWLQFAGLQLHGQITINEKHSHIFTALLDEPIVYLTALKTYLSAHKLTVEVGLTGCGGLKYLKNIKNIFEQSYYVSQFEANPQGLYLYDKIGMKVTLHLFTQGEQAYIQYTKQYNKRISDIESNFMFVSIGSGVNFQKFGLGQNGIQRKKVEDPSTSYDGYSLGGTCLGAAYLMGLVGLLRQQTNKQSIVQSIKQDVLSRQIYNMVVLNVMQHTLSLSIIHKLDSIVIAGNIFKIKGYIDQQFKEALKLNGHQVPFKRFLFELNDLGGFIGALGAVHKFI